MSDEQIEVVVEVPSDVTEVVVEVPSDVTEVVVYEGMVGPKGDPGPQGPQGPQGDPTTVNGKTGASITLDAGDVGAIPATDKGAANGVATLDSTGKVTGTQLPPLDYIPNSQKGAANGVATLDGTGKVTGSQLPSLDYIPNSQKGAANGVATLDGTGKVPTGQIPALNYDPAGAAAAAQAAAISTSEAFATAADVVVASNAAADATSKANAAQAAAISTSEAFATAADVVVASNAAADATSKANAAQAAAISTAEGYADANFIPLTQRGAAAGVATLDGTGKVPTSQLPPLAITDTFVVNSQAAMLALDAQVGDVAVRTDVSKSFILKATPASTLANWQELLSPPNAVSSVDGRTGSVSLTDLYDASGAAGTVQTNLNTHTGATTSVHGIPNTANLVATTDTGTVTSTMIANGTILDADISNFAGIAKTKINGTAITAADTATVTNTMLAGSIAASKISGTAVTQADTGTVTNTMLAGSIAATKISGTAVTQADTGTVTSTMIANGTIVDADINSAAAIAATKISGTAVTQADTGTVTNTMLAGSIAPSKVSGTAVTQADTGTVTSTMILDNTIVNADINAAAAIDKTKISGTAVTQADTGTVTSAMIANGTIVDADISSSAAIATSKLAANAITIDGVSVPLGGTTSVLPTDGVAGMVLAKRTNADYDTQWVSTTITGAQGYYGSFYDTVTQTAASTTVAYPVNLNTFDSGNGISIPSPSGGSRITFAYTGVYNIQISAQLANNHNSDVNVNIWMRLNGVDVPGSTGQVSVPQKHGSVLGQIISSWDYLTQLDAGDYIEFYWQTENTQAYLEFIPAGTTPATPTSPSFAVTAHQVTNLALPQGTLTVTAPITNTGTGDNYVIGIDQAALSLSKTQITGTAITAADTGTVTSTMILDGTIVNADISASAAIDKTKISGTAVTQADTGTVTSTMIANNTIVDADINAAAAIAATKISGTAVTQADTGTVTSTMIANNTIVDADINAAAAIAATKISGTAVTQADTGTVTSTMIANNTIVDADISASAAIAPSKIGQASATNGQSLGWNGSAWAAQPSLGFDNIPTTVPGGIAGLSSQVTAQQTMLTGTYTLYLRLTQGGTMSAFRTLISNLPTVGTVQYGFYSNTGDGVSAKPGAAIWRSGSLTPVTGTTTSGSTISIGSTITVKPGDWFAMAVTGWTGTPGAHGPAINTQTVNITPMAAKWQYVAANGTLADPAAAGVVLPSTSYNHPYMIATAN